MLNSKIGRRFTAFAAMGLLALAHALPARAGLLTQVAYYPSPGTGLTAGLLIDWQGDQRVRLVNHLGARSGTAARPDPASPRQTVITLDAPLSTIVFNNEPDSCGQFPAQIQDTRQIVVRDTGGGWLRGTTQVVEIGTLTPIEGCDAGVAVPFGAVTDAGDSMMRVAMVARPLSLDVRPGTRLAGFSDQPWLPDAGVALPADVVSFYAGNQLMFSASGRVVPAAFNADRWLVLDLGGFERAYTRLAVDLVTGAETWLRAEWAGGEVQRVAVDSVVTLGGPAGFGTEQQAARVWESSVFTATRIPFFIELYQGGTGARVSKDLDAGTEDRVPLNWRFNGVNIVQTRAARGGYRERTWVPLRNRGGVRFVMESEVQYFDDGRPPVTFIAPRLNHYIDRGAAVQP